MSSIGGQLDLKLKLQKNFYIRWWGHYSRQKLLIFKHTLKTLETNITLTQPVFFSTGITFPLSCGGIICLVVESHVGNNTYNTGLTVWRAAHCEGAATGSLAGGIADSCLFCLSFWGLCAWDAIMNIHVFQ